MASFSTESSSKPTAKARVTKTKERPGSVAPELAKGTSSEVAQFQNILATAKSHSSKAQAKSQALTKETTLTFQAVNGTNAPISALIDSDGLVKRISFANGRAIEMTAKMGKQAVYCDTSAPSVRLTNLAIDSVDGSIMYKRALGKRTATMKETASGAKYATISMGREKREIQLLDDKRRVYKGKEGTMTVSPDGSLVSLKPKAGGSIDVYPWVKLVAVEFPDGHKQTFYASDREVGLLKKNPVGFYVNWLPTDKQGRHFEWGTLELG
ncbi:MAG: hypothetical protein SFV17_12570 [Candidatus Obscuribacter sp.]|nr:hypothetical protein [Candidatus Melainabacteria bacterium]MDX1987514.1 hypothetical protein [Candidatus Obscuribacter sp.]